MKRFLKIFGAVALVAILWLGYSFVRFVRDDELHCSTVTLGGDISAETFVKIRGCLARSREPKKTFVITHSPGGDNAAALAIGILMHRHNWDVEIVDYCGSACATYLFTAGKTKYLNRHALLLFHGSPSQENLLEFSQRYKLVSEGETTPTDAVTLGEVNRENTITIAPKTAAYKEVHEFLSIPDDATPMEGLLALRKASDQFYQELGINPLLPAYGQLGEHEATYKSYKHVGYTYGLDSLRRFGVRGIEPKEGEWHPERHPAYAEVYEVTYP